MIFKLPDYVLYCLETLENNGFEAWCVGGAVRDHIMGKTPCDYDITTNAKPDKIISIFPKTVPTGIQHGTVTVVTNGGNVEVTTYRSDGEYLNNRTPENVTFVSNIDVDISRRDFTMNAICFNPKIGFYDPQNGIDDINNKVIRAIGDPKIRFNEDALRIIRAFRFSSELGFEIEENTKNAAISHYGLLRNISAERIYAEFKRALTAKFVENIAPILENCALSHLGLPMIELPQNFNLTPNDFSLRIACICYIAEIYPRLFLKRLKADNSTLDEVITYYWLLKQPLPTSKIDIKKLLKKTNNPVFLQRIIDIYTLSDIDTTRIFDYFKEIINYNEPYRIDMLDISGNELIDLGFKGKEIGEKLEFLLDLVIKDPSLNEKNKLIEILK